MDEVLENQTTDLSSPVYQCVDSGSRTSSFADDKVSEDFGDTLTLKSVESVEDLDGIYARATKPRSKNLQNSNKECGDIDILGEEGLYAQVAEDLLSQNRKRTNGTTVNQPISGFEF